MGIVAGQRSRVWPADRPRHRDSAAHPRCWETPALLGDAAVHAATRVTRGSRLEAGGCTAPGDLGHDHARAPPCRRCCPASRVRATRRRADRSGPPPAAGSGRADRPLSGERGPPRARRSRRRSTRRWAGGHHADWGWPGRVGSRHGGSVPAAPHRGTPRAAPPGAQCGYGRWYRARVPDTPATRRAPGHPDRPVSRLKARGAAVAGHSATAGRRGRGRWQWWGDWPAGGVPSAR